MNPKERHLWNEAVRAMRERARTILIGEAEKLLKIEYTVFATYLAALAEIIARDSVVIVEEP